MKLVKGYGVFSTPENKCWINLWLEINSSGSSGSVEETTLQAAYERQNVTVPHVSYFIIVGFSGLEDWPSRSILFSVFLVIYIVTVVENVTFVLVIKLDCRLHSPMYIFICNLAILDILNPSATVPEMLYYTISNDKSIYFAPCFFQMAFYLAVNITEGFTIVVMAYDRYQAICNPLFYPSKMTNIFAIKLAILSWMPGTVVGFLYIYLVHTVFFCGPNKIMNYFCDYTMIMELACSDVTLQVKVSLLQSLLFLSALICCITFSYVKILISVFKVASSEGRWKAFSTCASHLLVIAVHMLVLAFVLIAYRIPGFSSDVLTLASVLQNVIPSLVNPIIYCLKTTEIRTSFIKILKRNMGTNK
ncbi:olfactory receptor 10J4-like [Protopterus annectens]|uniref:olfactory receptor 10J4-like n=1 Tax=Protopterus annectens TaxID=7888 RepID=UPI001CF95060|nr:olfactory receptor 10J4-like [Protopterus annectens]